MYIKSYNEKTNTLVLENKECFFKGKLSLLDKNNIKNNVTYRCIKEGFGQLVEYLGWY